MWEPMVYFPSGIYIESYEAYGTQGIMLDVMIAPQNELKSSIK